MAREPLRTLAATSLRAALRAGLVGVALDVAAPSTAHACGAAYPGGPMMCTMADAPSKKSSAEPATTKMPEAHVSASWSYTSTTILFSGSRRAELTRHTVFAGTELPPSRRLGLGLRFGAGGILTGELVRRTGGAMTFGPGVSAFVGASKTVLDERELRPFLQLGATLSASRAATRGPTPTDTSSFTAFDLRASATAGKTLLQGVVVPYVALRAFGGPIFYRYLGTNVTGTDLHKYQVALGLSVALPSHLFDAFIEAVPLGERGLSTGLGTTF